MVEAQTQFIKGTEAGKGGFPENYINKIFIDTDPKLDDAGDVDLNDVTSGKWAWLAAGINTETPSSQETSSSEAYYDGGGYTDTEVTGKQISIAVSGFRKVGDPAQDFIADLFFKFGTSVKTRVIWINNGIPVISSCTISNIVPLGGQPNAKQTFSCTISFNGRPKEFIGQLTLTATSTKRVYSALVDTSVKPVEGQKVEVKVIEEATDASTVKVTGFTVDKTDVAGNVGDKPKVVVSKIVPDNATDKKLTVTPADTTIATAKLEDDGLTVDLNLLKAGSTKVTVASEDGGFSKDVNVTVNA